MLAGVAIGVKTVAYAIGCNGLVRPVESFGASSTCCRSSLLRVLLERRQSALVGDILVGNVVERHGCRFDARESAVKGRGL